MLICLGSGLLARPVPSDQRVDSALQSVQSSPRLNGELQNRGIDLDTARNQLAQSTQDQPPGLAIPDLALVNALLLLALVLTALPMLIGDRATGTVQGIVSIIGGLIGLVVGITLAVAALAALILMVSLLLAVPFGTLAYLAIFGSFDTGTSAAVTTVVLAMQIIGLICLILAQERFLKSKGLMLLFGTTILLTFVVSLLHSIVPGILVSITDAIGGIVIGIVGAIWALVVLIGGIVAAARLLQVGRQGRPGQLSRTAA